MKKLLPFLILAFIIPLNGKSQVFCVFCYDRNDSISSNVTNLVQNGGFENSTCTVGGYFCPASSMYSCDINNWTCTGGGTSTYCNLNDVGETVIVQGTYAAYLGNYFCQACSATVNDTSCITHDNCEVGGFPPGYPVNTPEYGGTTGVSISQTVSGLTVGNRYVLEFWAGGEAGGSYFTENGVFGLDIGFGYMMLVNKPTAAGSAMLGSRYIIEFRATSTSHTIKFTNWGHICAQCSEAILDDIRLYSIDQLDPSVPRCDSSYVDVRPADSLMIPNVFSPNGLSPNNLFKVYYTGIESYDMTIYNRWGQQLFHAKDKAESWDGKAKGKDVPDGTYYYVLVIGEKKYPGFLTLVR